MGQQDAKVTFHGARGGSKRRIVNFVAVLLFIASANYTWATQEEGDWCINDEGEEGICRHVHQCPGFLNKIDLYHFVGPDTPGLCSYSRETGGIACCINEERTTTIDYRLYFPKTPRNPSIRASFTDDDYDPETPYAVAIEKEPAPLRISEQKCQEYEAELGFRGGCYISPKPVKLIVGGYQVGEGEYPHMAALGFYNQSTVVWGCGGTLISHQYILTAAHCKKSALGKEIAVARLGKLQVKEVKWRTLLSSAATRSDNSGDYLVARTIVHPDYKPYYAYNDIALVQLIEPIKQFNELVRPACLYTDPGTNGFRRAVATGWGDTQNHAAYSEERSLMQVDLNLYDGGECTREYAAETLTSRFSRGIDESMLCAGDLDGGKDTCQGDSGGPLQVRSRDLGCFHRVLGVTSVGKSCGSTVALYTRVSSFISWIESIVWPDGREERSLPNK